MDRAATAAGDAVNIQSISGCTVLDSDARLDVECATCGEPIGFKSYVRYRPGALGYRYHLGAAEQTYHADCAPVRPLDSVPGTVTHVLRRGRASEMFAQRLRKERRSRDWSAARLADEVTKLGGRISRGTIAKLESNTRGSRGVTLDEALLLSTALDVPLTFMVGS